MENDFLKNLSQSQVRRMMGMKMMLIMELLMGNDILQNQKMSLHKMHKIH